MDVASRGRRFLSRRTEWILLALALGIPVVDLALPGEDRLGDLMPRVFVYCLLGLGLNIVTGFTGLLNLGVAAFMAIGAYTYAILTCEIYPFRLSFWEGALITPIVGAAAGFLLGAPTLRLRGDYLAIVTLGFGEIVQDILKNLDGITKGTQGINPLPAPTIGGLEFSSDQYLPWYFLYLAIVIVAVILSRNLENSRLGRAWVAIREDELAAACMGVNPVKVKLLAFAAGAAFASLAGALYATRLGGTSEPSAYDFQRSIVALCIVIVGGMGSINGVLLGALIMMGVDQVLIPILTDRLQSSGAAGSVNVLLIPTNWKLLIFGLALVLMMRFKPEGLIPSSRVRAELHHGDAPRDGCPPEGGRRAAERGAP